MVVVVSDILRQDSVMATGSSFFSNGPLEHNEIRVPTLLPGRREDLVMCRLKVVSLNQAVYYVLSYAWGDPDNTLPMRLQHG